MRCPDVRFGVLALIVLVLVSCRPYRVVVDHEGRCVVTRGGHPIGMRSHRSPGMVACGGGDCRPDDFPPGIGPRRVPINAGGS